jgi:cation diffusion facilitator CzcD-associated flavoprotein CzcO
MIIFQPSAVPTSWGVTVAGYPNLFFLIGPNSRVGHSSIVFKIEAQVHYVMQCLKLIHKRRATVMEVRPEAQAEFNRNSREVKAEEDPYEVSGPQETL